MRPFKRSNKIISQIKSLSQLGVDIKLFTFGDIDLEIDPTISYHVVRNVSTPDCNGGKSIIGLIRRDLCINRTLRLLFKSLGPEDIIYSRIPTLSLSTWITLKKPRDCKFVVEFNSIENREARSTGRYLFALMDSILGRTRRQNLDGIVGVTEEITSYELKKSGDVSTPHITIGNGIEVNSVPLRRAPKINGKELELLCVANVCIWHGLDRLLRGMAAYEGMPKLMLHIAGDGPEIPRLQKLAVELGISDRVFFHGFITGEALDTLFDQCHIAVGVLGIHRKGMREASALKVREYCARGIPFICGAFDADFSVDFPYVLHFPADESIIDVERIVEFGREMFSDPDHPQKMRRYAEENLDWSVKMEKLKDFLEKLVETN